MQQIKVNNASIYSSVHHRENTNHNKVCSNCGSSKWEWAFITDVVGHHCWCFNCQHSFYSPTELNKFRKRKLKRILNG